VVHDTAIGDRQIGVAGAADREQRPAAAGQHQARQAHGPPRVPQLAGKLLPPRGGPPGEAAAPRGRPQVAEQAGELPRIPRLQRQLHPVQEGVVRQAAVGRPFPEHFDNFVAVRVGYPERRPLLVQGRHIKTITPAGAVLPWLIFKIKRDFPRGQEIALVMNGPEPPARADVWTAPRRSWQPSGHSAGPGAVSTSRVRSSQCHQGR
jgi:hypothetical protein